ncbi:MAG: replicative helicase loader/inhibitor [Cellulosilyticaceae bacterium]
MMDKEFDEQQNKKRFSIIMAMLKSNFTNWKIDLDDKLVMKFWYEALQDIQIDILELGVKKIIMQEEFCPNIAKIRKMCLEVVEQPRTDPTEAWGLVRKAIHNFGYSRAEEALASLPQECALAVKYMGGWSAICESENIEADRAHFYRSLTSINDSNTRNKVVPLNDKINPPAMLGRIE